jgi:rifampicin phosphotransferase
VITTTPSAATRSVPGLERISNADAFMPVAGGAYIGQPPSKRFPVYTRGNAGEVYPEVVFPLTFTMSWASSTEGFRAAIAGTGALTHAEISEPTALVAVLGGYTYLNLSANRVVALRVPGGKAEDADMQYFGASTAVHRRQKGDRSLRQTVDLVRFSLRSLKQPSMDQQLADEAEMAQWKAANPDPATLSDAELIQFVEGAAPLAMRLFEHHLSVSGKAGIPLTLLTRFCDKTLKDPTLLTQLVSGIGGIDSAAPALALWDLGRRAVGSAAVTGHFDSGLDGLEGRLRADHSTEVVAFVRQFDEFLQQFGSRGPNEWETGCPTWGTDHQIPLALIDRLRRTSADNDPRIAAKRLNDERQQTYDRVTAKLSRRRRKQLDQYLSAMSIYSQGREKAKTVVVDMIHELRLATRELGRRCAARAGDGARFDDIWFVTADELDSYVATPAAFGSVVAERRAMREKLSSRIPPFIVDGELPPFDTWELRDAPSSRTVSVGTRLSGMAGCPGLARGRARVVLDPTDPRGLEPGDVLVAPLTDPSWTPLFLAAEAVVVDVGATLSHAVIVSRELGIPSVVSVTDATRVIPDGALIEVDGAAGTVTVIELP